MVERESSSPDHLDKNSLWKTWALLFGTKEPLGISKGKDNAASRSLVCKVCEDLVQKALLCVLCIFSIR